MILVFLWEGQKPVTTTSDKNYGSSSASLGELRIISSLGELSSSSSLGECSFISFISWDNFPKPLTKRQSIIHFMCRKASPRFAHCFLVHNKQIHDIINLEGYYTQELTTQYLDIKYDTIPFRQPISSHIFSPKKKSLVCINTIRIGLAYLGMKSQDNCSTMIAKKLNLYKPNRINTPDKLYSRLRSPRVL